ncbi:hypothetical protein S83_013892 [Arachis hypogaea]
MPNPSTLLNKLHSQLHHYYIDIFQHHYPLAMNPKSVMNRSKHLKRVYLDFESFPPKFMKSSMTEYASDLYLLPNSDRSSQELRFHTQSIPEENDNCCKIQTSSLQYHHQNLVY